MRRPHPLVRPRVRWTRATVPRLVHCGREHPGGPPRPGRRPQFGGLIDWGAHESPRLIVSLAGAARTSSGTRPSSRATGGKAAGPEFDGRPASASPSRQPLPDHAHGDSAPALDAGQQRWVQQRRLGTRGGPGGDREGGAAALLQPECILYGSAAAGPCPPAPCPRCRRPLRHPVGKSSASRPDVSPTAWSTRVAPPTPRRPRESAVDDHRSEGPGENLASPYCVTCRTRKAHACARPWERLLAKPRGDRIHHRAHDPQNPRGGSRRPRHGRVGNCRRGRPWVSAHRPRAPGPQASRAAWVGGPDPCAHAAGSAGGGSGPLAPPRPAAAAAGTPPTPPPPWPRRQRAPSGCSPSAEASAPRRRSAERPGIDAAPDAAATARGAQPEGRAEEPPCRRSARLGEVEAPADGRSAGGAAVVLCRVVGAAPAHAGPGCRAGTAAARAGPGHARRRCGAARSPTPAQQEGRAQDTWDFGLVRVERVQGTLQQRPSPGQYAASG
ncbi:hypothetical protein SALBM311S_02384 [Streptomyces alboniger]